MKLQAKISVLIIAVFIMTNLSFFCYADSNVLVFPCDSFDGIIDKENISLYEIYESDQPAFYDDFSTLQKSGDGAAYVVFEIPYASSAVLTTYHYPSEAMDFTFSISDDQENWQTPAYTKEVKEEEGKWTTYVYSFENLSASEASSAEPTALPTSTVLPEPTASSTEEPVSSALPTETASLPEYSTEPTDAPLPSATADIQEVIENDSTQQMHVENFQPEVKGVYSTYTQNYTSIDTRYLKVTWPQNPTWWTPLIAELRVQCTNPVPKRIEIQTTEPWIIPIYGATQYPLTANVLDQMDNPYTATLSAEISSERIPEISYENEQITISSDYPADANIHIRFFSKEYNLSAEKDIQLKKALTGDLNQDLILDGKDLDIAITYLGKNESDTDWDLYRLADINQDGKINVLDIAYIARNCP